MLLFEQTKERQRPYKGSSNNKIADFEKKITRCPLNKDLETLSITLSIITTMLGHKRRHLIIFLIVLLYILLQYKTKN